MKEMMDSKNRLAYEKGSLQVKHSVCFQMTPFNLFCSLNSRPFFQEWTVRTSRKQLEVQAIRFNTFNKYELLDFQTSATEYKIFILINIYSDNVG